MLWNSCNQYTSKFGKRNCGHKIGKGQFFIPIPKKVSAKECSNYCKIVVISHASKVKFKMIQARLQQYMNSEFADAQAGFRKGRGTRDQIANIRWIIEKTREFQENIYCFIDTKAFDCVDHNKLWKILVERIPDHLTCLLRNLYAGKEATVGTRYGTTDWFQIRKRVKQGCRLSPCLFNFYAYLFSIHHVKCWAGWSSSRYQDSGRNSSNLRFTDDITLMAESKEELSSLLMKVKE